MISFNPMMGYLAAGALVVGAVGGYKVKSWQCDAAYAKVLEKAEKQRQAMQAVIDEKAKAYEDERARADVVSHDRTTTIREIYKTTPAPDSLCAPPPAAVRVLIESIGQPDPASTAR